MFGYVRPPLQTLPPEEEERFRQVYCGLCHTLARRYGAATSLILNYDFTFLSVLLLSGTTPDTACSRCVVSPVKGRCYFCESEALELAADQSVILSYWQLRDGIEDHDFWHGLKYRGFSVVLSDAYRKAAATRPEFDRITREQLTALHELEAIRCDSIDRASDAFARILSSTADDIADPLKKRILTQFLYHLGRWVYLVDAADDLKEDAKSGNYNPLALRYQLRDGCWTEEAKHDFALTLDHSIHMMATAYELWDFGVWAPIIQSTVYESMFAIGRSVIDGTFRAQRRMSRHRKKPPKDGEEYK